MPHPPVSLSLLFSYRPPPDQCVPELPERTPASQVWPCRDWEHRLHSAGPRLQKCEDCLKCVPLVEFRLEYWDARVDQAVLYMRKTPRANRRAGAGQKDGIRLWLSRHLRALKHNTDCAARLFYIEWRILRRDNDKIRLRDRVDDRLGSRTRRGRLSFAGRLLRALLGHTICNAHIRHTDVRVNSLQIAAKSRDRGAAVTDQRKSVTSRSFPKPSQRTRGRTSFRCPEPNGRLTFRLCV